MKKIIISILFITMIFNNKKVIVIDPGHGGKDPGTSYNNVYEKDIVLEISKAIYNELKDDYTVYLTRYDDYDLSSPKINYRKRSDFDNRIKYINSVNADLYLSIHLNYYSDSKYYGTQIFYDDINTENKKLAELFQTKLNNNRKYKRINNLYLFKNITIPGLLIEVGFLSNASDRNKLQNIEYQKEFANKIKRIIDNYYNK